jgi:hypothetical protein
MGLWRLRGAHHLEPPALPVVFDLDTPQVERDRNYETLYRVEKRAILRCKPGNGQELENRLFELENGLAKMRESRSRTRMISTS